MITFSFHFSPVEDWTLARTYTHTHIFHRYHPVRPYRSTAEAAAAASSCSKRSANLPKTSPAQCGSSISRAVTLSAVAVFFSIVTSSSSPVFSFSPPSPPPPLLNSRRSPELERASTAATTEAHCTLHPVLFVPPSSGSRVTFLPSLTRNWRFNLRTVAGRDHHFTADHLVQPVFLGTWAHFLLPRITLFVWPLHQCLPHCQLVPNRLWSVFLHYRLITSRQLSFAPYHQSDSPLFLLLSSHSFPLQTLYITLDHISRAISAQVSSVSDKKADDCAHVDSGPSPYILGYFWWLVKQTIWARNCTDLVRPLWRQRSPQCVTADRHTFSPFALLFNWFTLAPFSASTSLTHLNLSFSSLLI